MPKRLFVSVAVLVGLAVAAFFTRDFWTPWLTADKAAAKSDEEHAPPLAEVKMLKLSPQARTNLGLVAKPVALQPHWRTIQVPGVIVDRPGQSDRGVTAPAVSVVTRIHAFAGDTMKVGERLFTLRLISESLLNSQTELYKNALEIKLTQTQLTRQEELIKTGAGSDAKLQELQIQFERLLGISKSIRQDLLTRGLTPAQLDNVVLGNFASEIDVLAPPPLSDAPKLVNIKPQTAVPTDEPALTYEVQELKVEVGQLVQAGQLLSVLANHQALYIEGHSFRREARFLEEAAKKAWPVRVEFGEDEGRAGEDAATNWPVLKQTFHIRHLANSVDTTSRTFAFYVPLVNQSRSYTKEDKTFLVWRFRPGQRVRLHIPVEEMKDVIVLPPGGVVREGPEVYAFRQNGDLFERLSVHVLHEDRLNVVLDKNLVLDKGGRVIRNFYLAQSAAASLNRILKAQHAAGGLPPGAHFHADGSLHIPGQ